MLKIELSDAVISRQMKLMNIYEKVMNCQLPNIQYPIVVYKTGDNVFIRFSDKEDKEGELVWIYWKDMNPTEEEFYKQMMNAFIDMTNGIVPDGFSTRN